VRRHSCLPPPPKRAASSIPNRTPHLPPFHPKRQARWSSTARMERAPPNHLFTSPPRRVGRASISVATWHRYTNPGNPNACDGISPSWRSLTGARGVNMAVKWANTIRRFTVPLKCSTFPPASPPLHPFRHLLPPHLTPRKQTIERREHQ